MRRVQSPLPAGNVLYGSGKSLYPLQAPGHFPAEAMPDKAVKTNLQNGHQDEWVNLPKGLRISSFCSPGSTAQPSRSISCSAMA
ncbi:protein of unknown function (plasmid) [Shinella sp. WSC3-e]|nr:protein of unknown function [Shinella sp. WSC3-e]